MQQTSTKRVKDKAWLAGGNMIQWELCKRSKFYHTIKWYMHKPESVRENEMHKVLWDFEIQIDPLILARGPDLVLINKQKRTCRQVDLAILADHRVKIKKSKR